MTTEKKEKNPGFDVASAPLLVPTLLEASAGTGKTFSIKHLVLRFIVEAGIPINHLLVMTFTRAATAELKARIESHLTEALGVLTGTIAPADADALTVKQIGLWRGMGIDDRDAEDRIRESLALFDNAGIFTIHSFCQKVIEDNTFSSGGTINFDLAASDEKFRSDAVRDFLRRSLDAMPEVEDRQELVEGEDWDKKLEKLVDYPESLVPRRWADFDNLSPGIQQAVSVFMTDVPGCLRDMKKNARVKTFNDLLRELYDRLLPGTDAPDEVRRQAERLAKRVRSTYRGVLIDEFQDTDPIQYAIVEKLFLSVYDANASPVIQAEREGRAIFFVGDPKQAIYRFR
ncbi:MAG: UvrD-helicase domain-containing protein, partial [Sutterella wadsworthensis]|nr:UvrD-helicase domain-containing protein [Sutterella wadsworthensis]